MKKEDLRIGLKIRNGTLKWMGTAATITELTEQGGFKYTVDKPYFIARPYYAEVTCGEVFANGLIEWEIVEKWKIEWDNDVGDDDDYYIEWWTVSDGKKNFKCGYEEDAKWLANLLNGMET